MGIDPLRPRSSAPSAEISRREVWWVLTSTTSSEPTATSTQKERGGDTNVPELGAHDLQRKLSLNWCLAPIGQRYEPHTGASPDSNPVAKGRMRRRQWSISHFYYQRYISRASSLSTLFLLSSPERLAPNIGTNKNERALQRSDIEINISTRQSPTLGLLSVNA